VWNRKSDKTGALLAETGNIPKVKLQIRATMHVGKWSDIFRPRGARLGLRCLLASSQPVPREEPIGDQELR